MQNYRIFNHKTKYCRTKVLYFYREVISIEFVINNVSYLVVLDYQSMDLTQILVGLILEWIKEDE